MAMAGTALPRQGRNLPCMATRQMAARKEAEHKRYVESRNQEEERRARHNLRRRAIKKRELVETFRRRRLQNFVAEALVTGPTRARPQPPPSERDPHHRHPRLDESPPKDRAICKRNGFIWSDLARTPKARLSLVVPPIAVKRDRECLERLLSTVEKEELEAREGVRRQRERIAAQHERWQLQASSPKARQAKIMAAITKKPQKPDKTAHNDSSEPSRSGEQAQDQPVAPGGLKVNSNDTKHAGLSTMSRRQEQLARPRKPADLKTAYVMLGSTDLVGLLHTEPALRGMLEGHLDDLRQNLTAARFYKHGGAAPPAQPAVPVPQVESAAAAAATAATAAASEGGGGGGGGGGGRAGGRGGVHKNSSMHRI